MPVVKENELTFEQAVKLLKGKKINNSEIARKMYPKIKSCSASGKLKNKLDERGRFRFTDEEKKKLVQIMSSFLKVVA